MTKALNALSYICHQWNYGLFAYILKHITLFYNRSIPSQSIWANSKHKLCFFFFHVASENMKYFRKMPTYSHLVLTVKHFHKVSLGFWYKVISQKQKSISCHYNFLLVSLKEIIDNEAVNSGRVTWKTNNCHIDTVEYCLRKWSMALCTLRVNFK